jgi:hypothetical protein
MRPIAILAPLTLTIELSLPGDTGGAACTSDTATPVEGSCDTEPVR